MKLRRYVPVRSLMSVVTGILAWAFISVCGLQLAIKSGVFAFALNYIPSIGPLVAAVLLALFVVPQVASWQDLILVFGCLNLIQFAVGSYLAPRIAGSVPPMSRFIVLFSLLFGTYLLGIADAFIAAPIVIAMLTICEQHESSRWVESLQAALTARAGRVSPRPAGGNQ
jgi:AI-2 transport protein TqsA